MPTTQSKKVGFRTPEDVVAWLKKTLSRENGGRKVEGGYYRYDDKDMKSFYGVIRFDISNEDGSLKKEFRTIRLKLDGRWEFGDPPPPLPLYRLPTLAQANRVFVAEGEKCAKSLIGLGLIATTPSHGAKSPQKTDWTPLAGKEVVILPDHDSPGEGFLKKILDLLRSISPRPTVKVLRLESMWQTERKIEEGDDIEQWLTHGVPEVWEPSDCRDFLNKAADEATAMGMAREEVRASCESKSESLPTPEEEIVFSNFHYEEREDEGPGDEESERRRVADRMADITNSLMCITEGWPKRVGPMLFVEGVDGKPQWLDSRARLFAWIDRQAKVDWTSGGSFISQERFYEDLRIHAEPFDAVEAFPHFPPLPRTYYMHPKIGPPGGKLEGLLDFFQPDSEIDRQLIKAFILSLFWGGLPGRRPVFLITGPALDLHNGRGVGKSVLIEILAQEFVGGYVEVPPTGDMEGVKTRLLSPGAMLTRVARLDNVKTPRFSWAEFEAIVTAGKISGKRLYQGEGTRLNTLVWTVSVNGESLSEDLAQRCVHVRLKRPSYDLADWERSVRGYIQENLAALLGDIQYAIENAAKDVKPSGRWGPWECEVLAATENVQATQRELAIRRDAMNADMHAAEDFRYFLEERLKFLGHDDPTLAYVLIPSNVMGHWLEILEQKKYHTSHATSKIRGFGIQELSQARTNQRRGWVWKGSCHDGRGEPTKITWSQAFPPPSP
jgi:hypothetical protein